MEASTIAPDPLGHGAGLPFLALIFMTEGNIEAAIIVLLALAIICMIWLMIELGLRGPRQRGSSSSRRPMCGNELGGSVFAARQ